MLKHVGFLRVSSVVVKVAAWIFLVAGLFSGVMILLGYIAETPRWTGIFIIGTYVFVFFFLLLIANIADLLVKIIHEMEKEENLIERELNRK